MRILARMIYSSNIQPEPVATKALAHILNGSTCLAEEFLSFFSPASVKMVLGEIVPEKPLDKKDISKGIPDLTIFDDTGHRRFLVENKFWTGLGDTQPVSYLKKLPDEKGFALLFIVPSGRISVVWNELRARCGKANLTVSKDSREENGTTWTRVGARTLLITSWECVLEKLRTKAEAAGLERLKQDIIQLKDLAKQEDSTAYLPLCAYEVTDQAIPKRLINYVDIALAVAIIISNKHEDVQLSKGSSDYEFGRYIRYGDAVKLWLGISVTAWVKHGISPLWCWTDKEKITDVESLISNLYELYELADHGIKVTSDGLYIPVQLKLGSDRQVLIDDAASKIQRIMNVLIQHVQQ